MEVGQLGIVRLAGVGNIWASLQLRTSKTQDPDITLCDSFCILWILLLILEQPWNNSFSDESHTCVLLSLHRQFQVLIMRGHVIICQYPALETHVTEPVSYFYHLCLGKICKSGVSNVLVRDMWTLSSTAASFVDSFRVMKRVLVNDKLHITKLSIFRYHGL